MSAPSAGAPRPSAVGRVLRVVIPALLIVAWVAAGGVGGPYFGKIGEVSSNDQTSYLPASADATRVAQLVPEFVGSEQIPAIVVFARDGGLTDADLAAIDEVIADVAAIDAVGDTSPAIPSDDGEAVEVIVPIDADADLDTVVEELRGAVADGAPDGVQTAVTGPAGFSADLVEAFAGIDGLLLLVALLAVFLILLVVYRSPLLPLLVLGTAVFSLSAAILAVWWLAYAGVVQINGQVQGILFILVIGAATDYALLYTARYREALGRHTRRWDATIDALKGAVEPILASGGTVIAGLLCLLFSDLNSNKALGPVGAIGIAFALLGSLTLLPALLLATGRAAFWPFRPKVGDEHGESRLWSAVARLVSRRARVIWIVSTLALLVAALGLTQLKADGVAQSELILGPSQARDGQELLGEHFPGGSGSPAIIVGAEGDLTELADAALAVDGVDSVVALSDNSPTGTMPVGTDAEPAPFPTLVAVEPTVVDGQVMLQATLADASDSVEAEDAVRALREAVVEVDPDAIVGGVTATAIDTDATSIRDRTVIIPIVLAVILLILMLLLRAVVAPLLLVGSVILSFAAALGVSALVFDHLFGFPGADPAVPLYSFVFLVALGVDYNIFLMTRVREESAALGTRPGILRGLVVTGAVITSAGVVLAATFAALGVIPILFLAQIAFIVAFGVLLDTILVRSLLVPAVAYDIGRAIWWPSKLARAEKMGT
ncbi:MMPL family transporter [Protaetiibacter mangrovi]|uniref:Efflux RND transporter permease subunit n=1 Tax=Protaetiibacter mangrovi TaxID=2970926 RepID=A0ABT1ZFU6_9MICO|nr:efflux RND transporter permease subunit [Protaetiibacter mangrovi]MCS0499565.1 efflux RND transporter permease subunit [Protaetiibacter mangrovi]TPW91848.1 MMPL family transporter [Schumannella luteola]